MQSLNSDQLRRQLDENNAAMNTLADDNEKIVELLSLRGLKAINSSSDLAEIRALLEPERRADAPLTTDELKAGGWWCGDVSEECQRALSNRKLEFQAPRWDGKYHFCFMRSGRGSGRVYRGLSHELARVACDDKQIHRIGNHFYWGAQNG